MVKARLSRLEEARAAVQRARDKGIEISVTSDSVAVHPEAAMSYRRLEWLLNRKDELATVLAAETRAPEPNAQGPPVAGVLVGSNGHSSATGRLALAEIATPLHEDPAGKAESGFAKIPHWVFGVPARHDLGSSGAAVFFQLLRWTLGFHRMDCTRSLNDLAHDTGLARSTVAAALDDLQAKGVISRTNRCGPTGQVVKAVIRLTVGEEEH